MIGSKLTKLHKPTGFTLMEILVVLGLTITLMFAIVNVFILTIRAHRQAAFKQETLSSVRFVVENIARQVRVSEIDFGGIPGDGKYADDGAEGILGLEQQLYLVDPEGRKFIYFLGVGGAIELDVDGQTTSLIDTTQIRVTKFNFFIQPNKNPFAEERCNGAQGCQPTSLGCTVNNASTEKLGFCGCASPSQCLTGSCSGGICVPFDVHPSVTIALEFETVGLISEIKRINLQTTASSRVYKR